MNWLFYRRRITSSLAALALLWAALAPSIGMAFVQGSGDKGMLLAVCSSTGLQYLKVGGNANDANAPGDKAPAQTSMAPDCPYCQLNLHLGLLPNAQPVTLHLLRVANLVFSAPVASPRPQVPWHRPPSHAPPL